MQSYSPVEGDLCQRHTEQSIDGTDGPPKHSQQTQHMARSKVQASATQDRQNDLAKGHFPKIGQFRFLATIGKGNYAKVMLAENRADHTLYAIKILKKESLIENDDVKYAHVEKSVLMRAREHNHPFIARLSSTFQTETRLCVVLEYAPGGDLMYHIQKGQFDVARSR